jgi:hypothetical protein
MGIYIDGGIASDKPSVMDGITCKEWIWDHVKKF